MNYAIITNNYVSNIIYATNNAFDKQPGYIMCDDIPINIGDLYVDGIFYHDGKKIIPNSELSKVLNIGNIVSGIELDFKSTENYNEDSIIIINGRTYKTIKSIPTGKKIYINEDVVETTITEFMEEKNNE